MTDQPAPDDAAAANVGWGGVVGDPYAPGALPPLQSDFGDYVPYAGQSPFLQPPKRPWYRVPGNLIAAATCSAVSSWVACAAALLIQSIVDDINGPKGDEDAWFGLVAILVLIPVIGAIGLAALTVAVAAAAVTVPLAVVWFRDPERTTGAGVAFVHAVIAWAATAVAGIRLLT